MAKRSATLILSLKLCNLISLYISFETPMPLNAGLSKDGENWFGMDKLAIHIKLSIGALWGGGPDVACRF